MHTPSQTLLHGGQIVTARGVYRQDILVEGKHIAALAPALEAPSAEQVDITGLTVFPGLIDAHVHLREPGGEHKEDFLSGTQAALAGGVTTVLAMPNTRPPITDRATLSDALALAADKAVCDFGLYLGATPGNAAEAATLDAAVALKMYVGSSTGDLLVDRLPGQLAHFEGYPPERIIAVHAEDEDAIRYYDAHGAPDERRPPLCAALAVARSLTLAEHTRRRVHICHVSTGHELALIQDARARGVRVTCEVTPHHLFLTPDEAARLGPLARVNPPLRDSDHIAALWARLAWIDLIATDHAPHTLAEKSSADPPAGLPGLETTLPLLITAMHQGRLSLAAIARLTATRPAEVFGLRRKGQIATGYDADLTLVDLNAAWTIGDDRLYTRCGWTPYAGRAVKGRVERAYRRGRLVYAAGEVMAEPGSGRQVVAG